MAMKRTETFHEETANKSETFVKFKARMGEKAFTEDMGIVSFAGESAGKGKGSCQLRKVVEEWVA